MVGSLARVTRCEYFLSSVFGAKTRLKTQLTTESMAMNELLRLRTMETNDIKIEEKDDAEKRVLLLPPIGVGKRVAFFLGEIIF